MNLLAWLLPAVAVSSGLCFLGVVSRVVAAHNKVDADRQRLAAEVLRMERAVECLFAPSDTGSRPAHAQGEGSVLGWVDWRQLRDRPEASAKSDIERSAEPAAAFWARQFATFDVGDRPLWQTPHARHVRAGRTKLAA
jgi:hypothetical protein